MSARRAKSQSKSVTAQGRVAVSCAVSKAVAATRINPEERLQRIAEAAYFRAQKRGFAPGGDLQDWLEAEAEVERQLGGR